MDTGILEQHDPNRLYWELEITKSTKDEATGDVIIEGIGNTGKPDEEGEQLVPDGMELSYFLKKGNIKWEHHNKGGLVTPDQFVGEPLEARITPEGFYFKGRLYGSHKFTPQIVEQMETMNKSNSSRKMGVSIEGSALARDPKNPGMVTKSIIRNIALTMNGVDSGAWARIAKSLDFSAGQDLFEFNLEKTLTTESAAPIMPQSLEGANKEPDSFYAFAARVRQVVGRWLGGYARQRKRREQLALKSITPDSIALDFYMLGDKMGLTGTQAQDAARYGYDRADLLKSIATKIVGGELQMSDILKSLDDALGDLSKSVKPDDEEHEAPPAEDADEFEDEDDDVNEETDPAEAEPDDDDDDKDDKGTVHKSLTSGGVIEEAIEVSDFLEALVGQVGAHVDSFDATLTKSISTQGKVNTGLAKSLVAMGGVMKSLVDENALLKSQLTDMKATMDDVASVLGDIAQRPVGRRAVTNTQQLQGVKKSLTGQETPQAQPLSKSMVIDHLIKGVQAEKLPITEVTLYETSSRIGPNAAKYLIEVGVLTQAN